MSEWVHLLVGGAEATYWLEALTDDDHAVIVTERPVDWSQIESPLP